MSALSQQCKLVKLCNIYWKQFEKIKGSQLTASLDTLASGLEHTKSSKTGYNDDLTWETFFSDYTKDHHAEPGQSFADFLKQILIFWTFYLQKRPFFFNGAINAQNSRIQHNGNPKPQKMLHLSTRLVLSVTDVYSRIMQNETCVFCRAP